MRNAYAKFLLARAVSGNTAGVWLAGVLSPSALSDRPGTGPLQPRAAAPIPLFLLLLKKLRETLRARYAFGAGLTWRRLSIAIPITPCGGGRGTRTPKGGEARELSRLLPYQLG